MHSYLPTHSMEVYCNMSNAEITKMKGHQKDIPSNFLTFTL